MLQRWPGAARFSRQPVRPVLDLEEGRLPTFVRPVGLDVIITPEGRAVLIELQHGFGRRGLVELYPEADRWYRRRLRAMKRDRGPCLAFATGLRFVCHDKVNTYRRFGAYQAPSFVYLRPSAEAARWAEGLSAELVLAKPPRGSNGRGIRVYERADVVARALAGRLPRPSLLQAFVPCKPLLDAEGLPHVGCIRHVVVIDSDGVRLSLIHMPSYWRVAPLPLAPRSGRPNRPALTANIARGAYPVRLDADEAARVHDLAGRVVPELVAIILGLDAPPPWSASVVPDRGGEPVPLETGDVRRGGQIAPGGTSTGSDVVPGESGPTG